MNLNLYNKKRTDGREMRNSASREIKVSASLVFNDQND